MYKKLMLSLFTLAMSGCVTIGGSDSTQKVVKHIKNTDICYMTYGKHNKNGFETRSYQVDCDTVSPMDVKTVDSSTLMQATLINGVVGRFIRNPYKEHIPHDEQPTPEVINYANGLFYLAYSDTCYYSQSGHEWESECSINKRQSKEVNSGK